MNIFNLKKRHLLITAMAVLALTLFIGGFLRFKQEERKRLELAGIECMEEVRNMTNDQIVEKINFPSSPKKEGESREMVQKALSYLFCDLRLNPTEEKYSETKENILKMNLTDESRRVNLAGLEELHPYLPGMREFTENFPTMIAMKEWGKLCIQDKPSPQLLEACIDKAPESEHIETREQFCQAICGELDEYSKNSNYLEEKILNFTDWHLLLGDKWNSYDDMQLLNELKARFSWRSAVVYRFAGKEAALKVCENLFTIPKDNDFKKEVRDNCVSSIEIFEQREKEKKSCEYTFGELVGLICQAR